MRNTLVGEDAVGTNDDDEEDEESHVVKNTRELAKHVSVI